jgi:hypothetical protein
MRADDISGEQREKYQRGNGRCARRSHEETAVAYLPQAGMFQSVRIGTILPCMTQKDRSILLMILGVAIVVIIYAAAYLPH